MKYHGVELPRGLSEGEVRRHLQMMLPPGVYPPALFESLVRSYARRWVRGRLKQAAASRRALRRLERVARKVGRKERRLG